MNIDGRLHRRANIFFPAALSLLALLGFGFYGYDAFSLQFWFSIIVGLSIAAIVISRFGLFDSRSLIIGASLIYALAGPIDHMGFEGSKGYEQNGIFFLLANSLLFVCILGLMFIALSVRRFANPFQIAKRWTGKSPTYMALIALASTLIIGFYVYHVDNRFGLSIGLLIRGDIYGQQRTLLLILKFAVPAILIYQYYGLKILAAGRLARYYWFLLALVFILVDVLVLGDRRVSFSFILAILCLSQCLSKRTTAALLGKIIPIGAVAVSAIIYGFVRNRPVDRWAELLSDADIWRVLNPTNTEFGAFAMIGSELSQSSLGSILSPTYLTALVQYVPRFVIENRPPGPSEWFVAEYFPDVAASGGGFAFNAVYESLMNFGYLGPLIVPIVMALAISVMLNMKTRAAPLVQAAVTLNLTFFMRLDFVSASRGFIFTMAFFAVCGLGHALFASWLQGDRSGRKSVSCDMAGAGEI